MAQITRDHAERIVKKLGGVLLPGKSSAHDVYEIRVNGLFVTTIGIRRSSKRDKGHDHVPREMCVGAHFAREFALCNHSVDDWANKLRERGLIPEEDQQ